MDRIITLASYVPTPTPLFCSLRDHSFPFDVVRPVPALVLDFSSPFLALPLSLLPSPWVDISLIAATISGSVAMRFLPRFSVVTVLCTASLSADS